MDAKNLIMQQQAADLNAAVKSGKTGLKLLDDSDNNIGVSQTLNPVLLPVGIGFPTFVSQPSPTKNWLLNLRAQSKYGQSVTVVMTAARLANSSGFVGPITGVLEFGNGSTSTTIEFDIPVGPFSGSASQVTVATQPQDGGAVIQVPSSIIRAYARYDNALIQPILALDGPVFGQHGTTFAVAPASGPFSPNPTSNDPDAPFPSRTIAPVNIKAFANYFGRHYTKLYRTHYLYVGDTGTPVVFAAGGPIAYAVPPFAKSVRVVRVPQTSAMTLELWDTLAHPNAPALALNPPAFREAYAVPSGPCPVIPIDGQATVILLSSTGNTDTVSGVKLVYEIGF